MLTLVTLLTSPAFAYRPIDSSASDLSSKRNVLLRGPVPETSTANAKRFGIDLPLLKLRSMLNTSSDIQINIRDPP